MNFFSDFQARAQQAVSAARDLASTVGAEALDTAQNFAATVSADARNIAADAKQRAARSQTGAERDKLLHVDITEDLRDFVSSLTYASFHDYDESAVRDADGPLEPWQVQHATAILKECPELENLRYVLCPKRMSEAQFWSIYFRLTSSLIGSPHAAEHSDDGGQGLHFADAVPRGKSSQTTPSGMSAWEDVAAPGSHSGSGDRQAAGAPIEGDDLDAYLKEMLDDDNLPAAASGDEAHDDLDEYLGQLSSPAADAHAEGNAAVDDQELAGYLDDLGLDEGAPASPGGGAGGAAQA